jgi:hypothetical protein
MTEINHFVKACAYGSFSTSKLCWSLSTFTHAVHNIVGSWHFSLMGYYTDRFLYNFTFEIGGSIYMISYVSLMIPINGENKTK